MKALRRYLPEINLEEERIPPSVLEKMEVRMEDFTNAYKEITPTAMREVYIEVPTVHWTDIGGLEEVKQELREAVEWPIKTPEIFERMGIRAPKGIMLFGPPGCGKTLLARAVATESEANFISIKGPEVFSKWVGESEKAIREVFRKSRMAAPAVIFFDEFDSLVPRRGMGYADSGVSERVISQLLTEMDGITTLEDVVIIAATNRPDIVDPAVLRPGRFDRLIYVPEPDEKARLEIFKLYTKGMPLAKEVELQRLAADTKMYSGADIDGLCREAGMNALRKDVTSKEVTSADFQKAVEKIGPTIQPDMETWYKSFMKQVRRVQKPTTPIA
jgi:transitional endoplasmic reticulum ATPase